jgi:hypothetical protein
LVESHEILPNAAGKVITNRGLRGMALPLADVNALHSP